MSMMCELLISDRLFALKSPPRKLRMSTWPMRSYVLRQHESQPRDSFFLYAAPSRLPLNAAKRFVLEARMVGMDMVGDPSNDGQKAASEDQQGSEVSQDREGAMAGAGSDLHFILPFNLSL
jgi:hypothetical protein